MLNACYYDVSGDVALLFHFLVRSDSHTFRTVAKGVSSIKASKSGLCFTIVAIVQELCSLPRSVLLSQFIAVEWSMLAHFLRSPPLVEQPLRGDLWSSALQQATNDL